MELRTESEKRVVAGKGEGAGTWMKVCGVRGGILQSCRLDILCFDGLAFSFMAVSLCCRGAVLKCSILK